MKRIVKKKWKREWHERMHAIPSLMNSLLPCVCSFELSELSSQRWRTWRRDAQYTVYTAYTVCAARAVTRVPGHPDLSQTSLTLTRTRNNQPRRTMISIVCCHRTHWGSRPTISLLIRTCLNPCMRLAFSDVVSPIRLYIMLTFLSRRARMRMTYDLCSLKRYSDLLLIPWFGQTYPASGQVSFLIFVEYSICTKSIFQYERIVFFVLVVILFILNW